MTNLKGSSSAASGTPVSPAPGDLEGGLGTLRGDCARMAQRWPAPARAASRPVPPSRIHRVSVSKRSVRLLEGMSEYGD
ncbi:MULTISPECIES: hypothetical protein [unclassified Streptomyces]|uniref:hypothetical protein n=1 Tax=unclassified Streptomyces TaxID=2593676 RepID=UPI001316CB84|nr:MULTISPECIES: hypothetical protein [unclassified Streptomyces]QHC29114.1 hypothetical protein GR129_10020 [Streptomyces sp. HF10]WKE72109.1 hypothetical protein QHG49_25385 [Streptomyces sp. WP-1]